MIPIVCWLAMCCIFINTECKVLRVTRKHNNITYPYKLNEATIESTDCKVTRDLKVLTSSTLTWSKQVDHLCNKATKMLGYVRRSTSNIKYTAVRGRPYLCLVRSKLCYRSQIWAPQTCRKTSKTSNKIHSNLPFRCDTSYNQRLAL